MDYAFSNTIGGTESRARNIISGNQYGIEMTDLSSLNIVLGNFIGTNISGESPIPNTNFGVWLSNAFANTIGGTASGDRNIISGNSTGIEMDANSDLNVVQGNFIGTDVAGELPLGNDTGVSIFSAQNDTIGGTISGAANVISGNFSTGIEISNSSASGNQVLGNDIGTNKEGTGLVPPAPNSATGLPVGVLINDAPTNAIGGPTGFPGTGAGNVIAGFGVAIVISGSNASGNAIQGNLIGTDHNGNVLSQSVGVGVYISGAPDNTVGGTSGEGNLIAGYASYGVYIYGTLSTGNVVQGDQIGVVAPIPSRGSHKAKRTARAARAGQLAGIAIQDASSNSIQALNTIAGNTEAGVYVFGHGNSASNNTIEENLMFRNLYGILLYNAPNNGGGSIMLRKINVFVKNNIAAVREFTGAVPSGSHTASKASTSLRKRRHQAIRPNPARLFRSISGAIRYCTSAPNHPRSPGAPGDRATGRIGS